MRKYTQLVLVIIIVANIIITFILYKEIGEEDLNSLFLRESYLKPLERDNFVN